MSFYEDYNDTVVTTTRKPELVRITGNSYPVKDQLKVMGCKWEGWAKAWFAPAARAAEAQALVNALTPKPDAAGVTVELTGEHIGAVGDKITVEDAVVETVREYQTEFNRKKVIQTMVVFRSGSVFKWTSSSMPGEVVEGATVTLTGTVKRHGDYKGERFTELKLCKVAGAVKLKPTQALELFCDAKSSEDRYAVCDEDGNVLEYGRAGIGIPSNGDNTDHELFGALAAFKIAARVREAQALDCLALTLNYDAKWMQGMVGKAKPLRDFAKTNKLVVTMNWISGESNPADEFTVGSRLCECEELPKTHTVA